METGLKFLEQTRSTRRTTLSNLAVKIFRKCHLSEKKKLRNCLNSLPQRFCEVCDQPLLQKKDYARLTMKLQLALNTKILYYCTYIMIRFLYGSLY